MSNNTGVVAIIDDALLHYADIFMKILLFKAQDTFLPEIFSIFDKEAMMKFLDIFSGCVIRVPDDNFVKECARLASVYTDIENSSDYKATIALLATRNGCTRKDIAKLYLHICEILEASGPDMDGDDKEDEEDDEDATE